jgi:hypothetical protein
MLLWFAISIAIVLAGSKAFFIQSSTPVANNFTAHPLVILMICSIFGWLKRDAILQQIDDGNLFAESAYLVAGAVIIIVSIMMPLSANYHFGSDAMWQMHAYVGYFLFPIWFAIFVYVYLKIGVMEYRVVPDEQLIIQNRG